MPQRRWFRCSSGRTTTTTTMTMTNTTLDAVTITPRHVYLKARFDDGRCSGGDGASVCAMTVGGVVEVVVSSTLSAHTAQPFVV